MKPIFSIITLSSFIFSCASPRGISESYIKANHQTHEIGKSSSIELFSIYYGFAKNQKKYIEFEGYKNGGNNFLVISVDDYMKPDASNPNFQTHEKLKTSIELTELEATLFMNSIESLQVSYMKNQVDKDGQYQEDFTITTDFYISYGTYKSNGAPLYLLDIWIKGQKYSVKYPRMLKELKRFLNS